MKKLLLLVVCVFFTHTTFAQSETQQKIQKRVERDTKTMTTQPSQGGTVIINQPPVYSPYYSPYDYRYGRYDRWGRRNRYVNPQPVLYSTAPYSGSFGVGINATFNQGLPAVIGPKIMVGGKRSYMKMTYQTSRNNPYSHYDNITIEDVINWNDEYVTTFTKVNYFGIGFAVRVNETLYPTLSLGNTFINDDLVYFDETGVLSNDGNYSINGYSRNVLSMGLGADFNTNGFIISGEYGIIGPRTFNFGVGYIF